MASTPKYKVHNPDGEYVAATRYAEDAAILVAEYGPGAKIKVGGRIVWREGAEEIAAGDSFDRVREIIHEREAERRNKAFSHAQPTRPGIAPYPDAVPAQRSAAIPDDPYGDLPGSGNLG